MTAKLRASFLHSPKNIVNRAFSVNVALDEGFAIYAEGPFGVDMKETVPRVSYAA